MMNDDSLYCLKELTGKQIKQIADEFAHSYEERMSDGVPRFIHLWGNRADVGDMDIAVMVNVNCILSYCWLLDDDQGKLFSVLLRADVASEGNRTYWTDDKDDYLEHLYGKFW